MKKLTYFTLMLNIFLCSCINSDYDFSNIDTTTRVPFKDLVMPINISNVPLKSVLDINDNSKIKEINGEYAVVIEGNFNSETISVDKFKAKVDKIEGISGTMEKKKATVANSNHKSLKKSSSQGILVATYDLPQKKTGITAKTKTLSDAIKGLSSLEVNTTLHLTINVDKDNKLASILKNIRIEDLVLQLPRGVQGTISLGFEEDKNLIYGNYNPETGIASFAEHCILTKEGEVQANVHVVSLDENAVKEALNTLGQMGDDFVLDEQYGLISGHIAVYTDDFRENYTRATNDDDSKYDLLPDNLYYDSNASMDDIEVNTISGNIDYDVADINLEKVNLKDIPDILSESGTCIELNNPQIYLYVNNPVSDGVGKTIGANTKIKICTTDKDGNIEEYNLDEGEIINANKPGNYFCLSPFEVPANKRYIGFEDSDHVGYSSLSKILGDSSLNGSNNIDDTPSGKGIPDDLDITVFDTHITSSNVEKYELGQSYNVNGSYVFFAPLELTENSKIRYSEKVDGWKPSLEGLVITDISVTANAKTDIPFDIILKIVPIDDEGNKINGEFSTALIPSKADNSEVKLNISGDSFVNVDGINLDVMAVAKETDVLKPDMNVSLNQIKVKVSGYYQTKL